MHSHPSFTPSSLQSVTVPNKRIYNTIVSIYILLIVKNLPQPWYVMLTRSSPRDHTIVFTHHRTRVVYEVIVDKDKPIGDAFIHYAYAVHFSMIGYAGGSDVVNWLRTVRFADNSNFMAPPYDDITAPITNHVLREGIRVFPVGPGLFESSNIEQINPQHELQNELFHLPTDTGDPGDVLPVVLSSPYDCPTETEENGLDIDTEDEFVIPDNILSLDTI